MAKAPIPHYSGWRPRAMRYGRRATETNAMSRKTKRERLGTAQDRALYTSAKGHKTNPTRYSELCKIADGLNWRK